MASHMDQREAEADAFDLEMMSLALEEARKCEPKPTAFSVGCVLVARPLDASPFILARSYSRELKGNTHAEANALAKARRLSMDQRLQLLSSAAGGYVRDENELDTDALLRMVDVYTTMEPCSVRTSGLAPCADALIDAGVSRCFIGVGEPDDFVKCEGAKKLTDAGIKVIWLKSIERECLEVARMGHSSTRESAIS